MASVIFLVCLFIFVVALYVNNLSAVKPSKNLVMGITLPYDSIQNSAVTNITEKYHKAFRKLLLIFSAGALPMLLVSQYVSLSLVYMFVWIALLLMFNDRILKKYSQLLLQLKKKNGWFTGNKNLVIIDTEVLKAKKKMPVSMLWFIPSVVIAFIPFYMNLTRGSSSGRLISSFIPVPLLLVFFLMYRLTSSQRATVYSNNTEINMACSLIYKRTWSVYAVAGAFVVSILNTVMSVLSGNSNPFMSVILVLLISLSFIFSFVSTKQHITQRQNKILEASESNLYTDDDDYWQGLFYNNPNDKRVMVEKRIGYGFTVNMATTGGKVFVYGFLGLIGVMLILLSGIFINMDFSTFNLSVREQTVFVDAPLYHYSFNLDEITEISTIDTLPSRQKTNGAETARYCLGHFTLKDYGASRLYVYKDNPPYIAVRLKDGFVLINGKTPEETQQYLQIIR